MATMTAAQKRAQAKAEYDAFLAGCPSRKLLDRLSDKWVALVLAALGSDGSHQFGADCAGEPRSMRYSELRRLLAGVSQKMLCSPTARRTTPAPPEPGSEGVTSPFLYPLLQLANVEVRPRGGVRGTF
jgi:hypothetical protein